MVNISDHLSSYCSLLIMLLLSNLRKKVLNVNVCAMFVFVLLRAYMLYVCVVPWWFPAISKILKRNQTLNSTLCPYMYVIPHQDPVTINLSKVYVLMHSICHAFPKLNLVATITCIFLNYALEPH